MPVPSTTLVRCGIQPYGGSSFSAVGKVATFAALSALSLSGLTTGYTVNVNNRATAGDQGGGLFYLDLTSVLTANGGTVLATSGAGRWLRIYTGPVNVRWFGAIGDGATNDLAAFQAANTASTSVFIPDGTYKLTIVGSAFAIVANTNWYGQSRKNTILNIYNTASNYINVFTINGDDVTFQDFSVNAYCTGILCSFISLTNGHRFTIDNVFVDGRYGSGAQIYFLSIADNAAADFGTMRNCDIKNTNIVVWTQTTLASFISGWKFSGNSFSGNYGSCLELHTATVTDTCGWRDFLINGNFFDNPGTSATIYSLGSISLANCIDAVIVGNVFRNHDNALDQYAYQCVHLENFCKNITITGNNYYKCKNPIVITSTIDNVIISASTFKYRDTAYVAPSGLTNKVQAIFAYNEPIGALKITDCNIINYERGAQVNGTDKTCTFARNLISGCYIGTLGSHGYNHDSNTYVSCVYATNIFSTLKTNTQCGYNTFDNCTNNFLQSGGDRVFFPRGFCIRGTTGTIANGASSFFVPIANPAILYGPAGVQMNATDATNNSLSAGSNLSQIGATLIESGLITQANAGITATGHSSAAGSLKFTFTNSAGTSRAFDWIWSFTGAATLSF